MSDQAVDWIIRGILALVTVCVALLGRDQKRSDELLALKLNAITDLMVSQLTQRDQRMDDFARRLDRAGRETSDAGTFIQSLEARLVTIEVAQAWAAGVKSEHDAQRDR